LVLDYHDLNQDADGFRHHAALLQPLAESRGASPYWLGVWWWRLATGLAHAGDTAGAETAAQRARELADQSPELAYAMAAEEPPRRWRRRIWWLPPGGWRASMRWRRRYATWRVTAGLAGAHHLLRRGRRPRATLPARVAHLPGHQPPNASATCRARCRQSHVLMEREEKAPVFEACIPHQTGGQRAMVRR
jgi:hypothetical protein